MIIIEIVSQNSIWNRECNECPFELLELSCHVVNFEKRYPAYTLKEFFSCISLQKTLSLLYRCLLRSLGHDINIHKHFFTVDHFYYLRYFHKLIFVRRIFFVYVPYEILILRPLLITLIVQHSYGIDCIQTYLTRYSSNATQLNIF